MFSHKLELVYLTYNLNCRFETEGHLKVTGSHVHCKSGNISEMMHDRELLTLDLQVCWSAYCRAEMYVDRVA